MRTFHQESLRRALLAAVFSITVVAGTGARTGSGVRAAATAARGESYTVFCVNGKLDFSDATLEKMRWDYGRDVCQIATFNSYREAKEFVRRKGGVGAPCKKDECVQGR